MCVCESVFCVLCVRESIVGVVFVCEQSELIEVVERESSK